MSRATRTQVYFTRELREGLDARAEEEGKSLAEVVREAAGVYLAQGETGQVTLSQPVLEALGKIAEDVGVSTEMLVRAAVEQYVEQWRRWEAMFAYGDKVGRRSGLSDADIAEAVRQLRYERG